MAGVFDIAPTVTAWLDAGHDVLLARVLTATGLAGREAAAVAAWTDLGDGPVGSALAARAQGSTGRVEVTVSDDEADGVGLACGGRATVVVQHATELPDTFWSAVRRGGPVGLVDTAAAVGSADANDATTAFGADDVPDRFARVFGRGVSQVAEIDGETLTTYWPRTRVVIIGGGPVAAALVTQAALLGWDAAVGSAADVADLGPADALVALEHDHDVAGPALQDALAGPVGYVGALGSRHTQVARREWLAAHGVDDVSDLHGPAGLDIGGFGPAEIALSICSEIVAVRSGRAAAVGS